MAYAQVSIDSFQGIGTVDAGSPPSGWTVATGSFRKRPAGPKRSVDTDRYSLLMPHADAKIAASAFGDGYVCSAWIMINEATRTDDGSHGVNECTLLEFENQYSEPGPRLVFTPSTGAWTPYVRDYLSNFTIPTYTGTAQSFGYNQWVFVMFSYVGTECRWYYKLPGGALTLWFAKSGLELAYGKVFAQPFIWNNPPGSNQMRWAGRVGLLGVATISSFADVTYPATFNDPLTTRNIWYCKRTGSGSGDGTTLGSAWSPAQMIDELTNFGIVPTSAPWKDVAGTAVANNTDILMFWQDYVSGGITHNGDLVRVDPEGGELGVQLTITPGAEGVGIVPYNASQVVFNASSVKSVWTAVSGHVWKVAHAVSSSILYEDSKWLAFKAHTGTTNALIAAVEATAGSFGCDDSFIYLQASDSSNPNSNGKVYEVSAADVGIGVTAAGVYLSNLKAWKTGRVANDGGSPPDQYGFFAGYAGLSVYDGVITSHAGKHAFGFVERPVYSFSRTIVRNCQALQCPPASYFVAPTGAQSAGVLYVDTTAGATLDNQIIFDTWNSVLNVGAVGSAAGATDAVTFSGFLLHNDGSNTSTPMARVLFRNFLSAATLESPGQPISPNPFITTPGCNFGSAFSPGETLDPWADFAPTVAANGQSIALAVAAAKDAAPASGTGHFALSGTAAAVSSWAISGGMITLALAGHVLPGQPVALAYTRANDATDIVDGNGNVLVAFSGASVSNGSTYVAGGFAASHISHLRRRRLGLGIFAGRN